MTKNRRTQNLIDNFDNYEAGFTSSFSSDVFAKGLNEDVIRNISKKNDEPKWLLDFRLKSFDTFKKILSEKGLPNWAYLNIPNIDFQDISYYSSPKDLKKSWDGIDPEIIKTFEKLGVPLEERAILAGVSETSNKKIAVDAVIDSVSVATTYKKELAKFGIIFSSFSDAVKNHPDLVQKYLASVVPIDDNLFAALNSAVFGDGSFVYIPKNVTCPMDLTTYFRINEANTGQFERTLIIADENASVSYLEGCTAPMRDDHQLHAAVVEVFLHKNADVKYSTVQNWWPGDKNGIGGILNYVTKRALLDGKNATMEWTQVEVGSAQTWKYPSCILKGDNSKGLFYSVALTNNLQSADTGTKMIHIGKNTKSTIISKGISAKKSRNTYRSLVKILPQAENATNFTSCDSMIIGDNANAFTLPTVENFCSTATVAHEATTSKLSENALFYLKSRGLSEETAVTLIVNGFAKDILKKLPMEFAVEAQKLLGVCLENSIG